MADELVIVPSDGEGYIDLARTKTGRLFRKHLLSKGDLRHPKTGEIIKVDDSFVKTLKANFDAGVCDIVQVPLADKNNEHSEDPERNVGEVVDLQVTGDRVYAVIDVRDAKHAEKFGKTYLGASAMMHLDYEDKKTGNKVGPTLLHSCVTNRPYVTGLESYEEIVAATDKSDGAAVLLTTAVAEKPTVEVETLTEEKHMAPEPTIDVTPAAEPTLEELLTALKTKHQIDVSALQAKAAEGDQAATLSRKLVDALTESGVVKLTATDDKNNVSTETVVSAVAELATDNVTLTNRVNKLETADAEHAVDNLIAAGRIMPKQRKGFVELKLSNPTMFDDLVPAEPIVKMSNESGVTPPQDEAHTKNVDAEILRLSELLAPVVKK